MITITMFTDAMKVWEEVRAVLPEEVTRDWNHFVEIFGRFLLSSSFIQTCHFVRFLLRRHPFPSTHPTNPFPLAFLIHVFVSSCSNYRGVFSGLW